MVNETLELKLPKHWDVKMSRLVDGGKCVYLYNTKEHKCLVFSKDSLYQLNDYPENERIALSAMLGLKTHKIKDYFMTNEGKRKLVKVSTVVNNIQKDDFDVILKDVVDRLKNLVG